MLIDRQENVAKQEQYEHYTYKLLNSDGVQNQSDITISFDPTYQTLVFHHITVIRNGKVENRLDNKRVQVIQREQNMDRHLYDGTLTAILNLADIRVGDIIDYSFTKKGYNPILDGHVARNYYLNFSIPVDHIYQRLLFPKEKSLKIKSNNTDIKPIIYEKGLSSEYIWEVKQIPAFLIDSNYPSWFDPYARVEVSDFDSWSNVVQWGIRHFSLTPSEQKQVKNIVDDKWSIATTPEIFVMEVIHFVQDEIRYLGFENGLNSHKPHSPLMVYNQRFGDCKDKSLLLTALLQARGIEAHPVLINTKLKDKLNEKLPTLNTFDHCVVELELDGKHHYVDPTISDQGGNIESIYFPSYRAGLVLKNGIEKLSEIPLLNKGEISEDNYFILDKINGGASWEVRTSYKGIEADIIRSRINGTSLKSLQTDYLTFYGNLYSNVQVAKPLQVEDDQDLNILVVKEYYSVPEFWKENEGVENQIYAEVYPISLETFFNISKYNDRKAPYPLSFPTLYKHSIQVTLPEPWTISSDETSISSDYYTYEYKVRYYPKSNMLIINTTYETLMDHVPVPAIPKMIEDHKVMMNELSYYLTYNQNASVFNLSLMMVMIGVILLLCASYGAYLIYSKYDPEPENSIYPGNNLGGWLVLAALGVILTPIRVLVNLLGSEAYFNDNVWNSVYSQSIGLASLVFGEYVFNIFYFVFSLLIIALFFNRRSSLPLLISIGYLVYFVMLLVDEFFANQLALGTPEPTSWPDIFRALLTVIVWVPYFHYSERVKNTFVLRRDGNDRNGSTVYTLHK